MLTVILFFSLILFTLCTLFYVRYHDKDKLKKGNGMIIASIILGIISLAGFSIWGVALKKMITEKDIRFEKVDTEEIHTESSVSLTGFSKEISYERKKGYETKVSQGMTYSEIKNGLKKKDPGTIMFVKIFAGFLFGILGLISSIGSAVAASGNRDGWYMISAAAFFFLLFVYIIIDQMRKDRKSE